MSKITPLANRILVRPITVEEKTLGGIILPDSNKSKPLRGEVVSTGNGTKDEEMLLSVGDVVLYQNGVGLPIEHDNEKYVLMSQFDVLAVLK